MQNSNKVASRLGMAIVGVLAATSAGAVLVSEWEEINRNHKREGDLRREKVTQHGQLSGGVQVGIMCPKGSEVLLISNPL